jgi:adenine-specific DNA-methyltransferase
MICTDTKNNMKGKNQYNIGEKLSKLKEIFPEIFSEDKVDLLRLESILGVETLVQGEHYELSWSGKNEARKEIQKSSNTTLHLDKENPLSSPESKNKFVEGENLEVLRVLQNTYSEKVKMIYIDPPYNTGNDHFVYHDNYAETLDNYKKRVNDSKNKSIQNTEEIWQKNTKENGQFHSNWLSMMYPRLYLSRTLLKDDGCIFISIDESEYANLKLLCDEVFGEENFRNTFIVRRYDKNINRQFMAQGLKTFNVGYEYILCYAKSSAFLFHPILKESSEERSTIGYWKGFWSNADRPTMRFDILGFTPEDGQWKWSKEKSNIAIKNYQVYLEQYASTMTLEAYWEMTGKELQFIKRNDKGKGKNQGVEHWIAPSEGSLRNTNWTDLFASKNEKMIEGLFDFPKNVEVIKQLILGSCGDNDLILDYFAGSGTTAQAVLETNHEMDKNLNFICIQMAEPLEEKSAAYTQGLRTIADITRLRIDKTIEKLKSIPRDKKNKNAAKEYSYASFKLEVRG